MVMCENLSKIVCQAFISSNETRCVCVRVSGPCEAYEEESALPTFNAYTKCADSPGTTHDLTPMCHPVSWA